MAEKRVYEAVFIIDPDTPEEDSTRLVENLSNTITEQGGTLTRNESMGRRNLAYHIGHKTEGNYWIFEIEGTGREIAELERRMRVADAVLRYMTVRVDEDRQRAEKFKERRTRKASKRGTGRRGAGAGAAAVAGAGGGATANVGAPAAAATEEA